MKKYKSKLKHDLVPLWEYLSLEKFFSYQHVDKAYLNTCKKSEKVHLAWKILRDRYFCAEYKKNKSTERIFESGFFDDEKDLDFYNQLDYLWALTPIHKIEKNVKKMGVKKKYAVLLLTGAFSPIHKGHIIYMNAAREELLKRGVSVVGGYISPSHDGYVDFKNGGDAKMCAKQRVKLCRKAVKSSEWLMIDGWESLGVTAPVLYTLVYERLKKYLSHHFNRSAIFDIYFVVGSDNGAYSRVFAKNGYCICIERSSFKVTYNQILDEYKDNKNIIFIDHKINLGNYSSTSVRGGDYSMIENDVINDFVNYKKE